jgi:membrane-associated phospholipid phosphatase
LLIFLKEYLLCLKLGIGLILILIITTLVRIIYFKDRPNKEEHHNWIERIDASSFPSMHTARIFFFGLVMSQFWDYSLNLTILFLVVSLSVSYSRIFLKKHDWWDLLGGLVLGVISFWIITFIHLI